MNEDHIFDLIVTGTGHATSAKHTLNCYSFIRLYEPQGSNNNFLRK